MRRVLAGSLAVVAALIAAAPAAAAVHRWRVTAVLSGSYANDVTATARCPARFAERVDGLRMTLRSGTLTYDPQVRVLTGALRYALRGTWRVAGSYQAAADQPDGTPACAVASTPVGCHASVVADDGLRLATSGPARLAVDDNRRGRVGVRIVAPRLTERDADAGTPPAGWPSVCRVTTDDPSVVVTPLFGLASTTIADRALGRRVLISESRLSGHRAFAVHGGSSAPAGCPAQGFDPCTEQGGYALTLTFRPAGR